MAMQQSGKGAGDGNAPNLSDEQADQFAASFTPAWDSDDALGDDTNGTANATIVDAPAVAPVALHKRTLMGQAPPANPPVGAEVRPIVPSSEAIDPENILESNTAPQPPIVAKPAAPAPAAQPLMKTQMMQGAPGHAAAQPKAQANPVARSAQPQPQPQKAAIAVSADPFKRHDDEDDVVPKKSSKTLVFVVAGLAVAAGIALVAKFAMSEDPPKQATTTQAVGPAIATAEIPPPPPKVETPPPPAPVVAAVTAVKPPDPPPAPVVLAAPPAPALPSRPTPVAADPAPHRQPRTTPAPQAAAAPPPLPAAPKTPPKTSNTGIVRDNPF